MVSLKVNERAVFSDIIETHGTGHFRTDSSFRPALDPRADCSVFKASRDYGCLEPTEKQKRHGQHHSMSGLVIWITGLPGSGKSTIADAVKQKHPDFMILRMDDLRKIVTPQPTYSEAEREMVYRGIIYMARILSELNHAVIIDATGHMRRWRDLARETLPSFMEVYLKCSLETCRQREEQRAETHGAPKGIYQKGKAGWPVPGVTVPYEETPSPEVVIDAEKIMAEDAAELIVRFIERFQKKS